MNILILTQKVDKGDGNLGFFHEWIRKFAGKMEKVFAIANFVGEHSLPANVRVYSLGKEKGLGRIRRYFNFYKYLFKTLPQSDAIFVHMIPAWVILAWPAAFIFRKKIYLWYTHKSVTLSLRLAEKLAEKIFTASKESCRLNSKKTIITGHGIDTEHFKPKTPGANSGAFKLLSAGRITPSKDYEFIIEAVGLANKGYLLDIIGAPIAQADFEYEQKLLQIIKAKKLENNIKFLGAKAYAEMPDIYNNHGVLLHASETGSLDKVVLEAMACGLPVITTSVAFKSMLEVAPKDARIFAEKIARLQIKNTPQRNLIIQNHDLNNLINKILANL